MPLPLGGGEWEKMLCVSVCESCFIFFFFFFQNKKKKKVSSSFMVPLLQQTGAAKPQA